MTIPPAPQTRPQSSISWPNVQRAAIVSIAFAVLIWFVWAVDYVLPIDLRYWGIVSWSPTGFFPNLLLTPVLHLGWDHLTGNSVAIIVLGFLAAIKGLRTFFLATGIILVITSIGVWFVNAPGTVSIGASGMIFGYFGYLIGRGVFRRSLSDILIAVSVIIVYGWLIWGIFPTDPQVSWQGHLFGLIGGLIAAWRLRHRSDKPADATLA